MMFKIFIFLSIVTNATLIGYLGSIFEMSMAVTLPICILLGFLCARTIERIK